MMLFNKESPYVASNVYPIRGHLICIKRIKCSRINIGLDKVFSSC